MWAPLPPAAYTSPVGTRHKVNKREPSIHDLGEKATPGCPAILAATQTNIWHPSEARLEAKGRRKMDSCWDSDLSQAGALRKVRSESGRQAPVPMLLPWHPNPRGPGSTPKRLLAAPTE